MGRPEAEADEVGWKADLAAKVCAAVSAVSFSVFVLALMAVTDPVTAVLLGNFRPFTCVITETFQATGATLCQGWSSCKNLCADPPVLYSCVHIHVRVFNRTDEAANATAEALMDADATWVDVPAAPNATDDTPSARLEVFGFRFPDDLPFPPFATEAPQEPEDPEHPVRFFVNAAGCGYELNCSEFQLRYGEVGQAFPCLYSHILNRTVPVDIPDLHDELVSSIVTPAVPAAVSLFSLAYLCCKGHCDFPRLTPRHLVVRMIKRKKVQVRHQIREMQKRGSIRSIRSFRSFHSSGPPTPQSVEWKKRPLPNITLQRTEDDLVVQAV